MGYEANDCDWEVGDAQLQESGRIDESCARITGQLTHRPIDP